MKRIIFCILFASVFCDDVYRFDIPIKKVLSDWKYCDSARRYHCPLSETCCPTGLNDPDKFKCCGLTKANCCNNGLACCPESYTCSAKADRCYPNLLSLFFSKPVFPVKTRGSALHRPGQSGPSDVLCPDGQTNCDDGNTCCQLEDKSFSCCPIINAVCCADHLHCCPHGTTCNVASGECVGRSGLVTQLLKKMPSNKVESVTCPGGQSQCGDGETCCQLSDGSYGCCPNAGAVCCSDHLHCCPHGTTCNVASGECVGRSGLVTKLLKKMPSKKVESVTCPDGQSQCGDGETCCQLSDGSYGCCPNAGAVCCSDHVHCCPHGTTCNVASGECVGRPGLVTQLLKKMLLLSKKLGSM